MSYLRCDLNKTEQLKILFLFKSRLIQNATYIRMLYLLYDKLASYLSRVLCKSRLILPRINGPIVKQFHFRTILRDTKNQFHVILTLQSTNENFVGRLQCQNNMKLVYCKTIETGLQTLTKLQHKITTQDQCVPNHLYTFQVNISRHGPPNIPVLSFLSNVHWVIS
jgi:hypothetical protein